MHNLNRGKNSPKIRTSSVIKKLPKETHSMGKLNLANLVTL
jgi:hypothetical protein